MDMVKIDPLALRRSTRFAYPKFPEPFLESIRVMANSKNKKENVHAAASEEYCEKMGKNNGWKLIEIRDNGDKILPKDCVFEGEQTSFEDTRYGD